MKQPAFRHCEAAQRSKQSVFILTNAYRCGACNIITSTIIIRAPPCVLESFHRSLPLAATNIQPLPGLSLCIYFTATKPVSPFPSQGRTGSTGLKQLQIIN
jgi:hypothetical protein